MPTQYGRPDSEASGSAGPLWNSAKLPDWLLLQGDVRLMHLTEKIESSPLDQQTILMRADAFAGLQFDRFIAVGSLGYADNGALGAAVTRKTQHNLVSREYWLGYWLEASKLLVRAGRMNLPFGIRNIEHTLWARALTHTSINDDQQLGAALALSTQSLRGELMAIAGNYQLRPDDFRERGYSAYLEYAIDDKLALGASSLVTHRKLDTQSLKETWRQAHGLFARWSTPWEPLVLLSEWDYALYSPKGGHWTKGVAGYVQGDLEITQGVHFLATGELNDVGSGSPPLSYSGWLSFAWFFLPQVDARLDGLYQSFGTNFGRTDALALLLQGHVYF